MFDSHGLIFDYLISILKEFFSGSGKDNTFSIPLEEVHVQFVFQLLNLCGYC